MFPHYLDKLLAVGHRQCLLLPALVAGAEMSVMMKRFHGDPARLHGCGHIPHTHIQGSWVLVLVCAAVPRGQARAA